MDLGLQGRAAVVAGASSGLGLAVAAELAREGAHVAICGRREERLTAAAKELDAVGAGQVLPTALDVRDHAAVAAWVEDAAAAFGALHIVVVNAGGPPPGTATAETLAGYRDALELNLLSSVALVQAALPHLQEADWGRIIFVNSIGAVEPIHTLAASSVARAGVLAYAKTLVRSLGTGRITVNVLAPGYTRTERLREAVGDEQALATLARDQIPLGRIGEPEEFAAVAAFLCSERAGYVTGTVIPVDGGFIRKLV